MRHNKTRYQLNRYTSWRKATLRSMVRNLLIYQSIKTTKIKAKAVAPLADKLISLGKEGTIAAKRMAFDVLGDHKLVSLLFADIAPRFINRNGGYTRVIPFMQRRGDNAEVVVFELTEKKIKKIPKKTKKHKEPVEVAGEEHIHEPEKPKTATAVAHEEKHRDEHGKPAKGFLKGIKGIFKKERDSL